jgi:glycosyltransferase involved in cell wall biosynthesis
MTEQETYPEISIILPTYNRSHFIIESIESVCKQTFTNWELLVIDDQSTDNTAELVSGITDKRVVLHKTITRLGITGTRNEGLRKANGNIVAFIDSDDLWAPGKLEKQVNALEQYPDAGFCFTGGFNFKTLNEPLEFFYQAKEGLRYGDLFLSFFKAEIAATTPSFIFRKKYLEEIGFFNKEKSFADIDFILRLAMVTKGIILYEPLFYRRLHDSNISNKEWEKGSQEGIELLKAYKENLPLPVVRNAFFKRYIQFGEKYLKHHKNSQAIGKFLKAWPYKPLSIVPAKKITKAILYSLIK